MPLRYDDNTGTYIDEPDTDPYYSGGNAPNPPPGGQTGAPPAPPAGLTPEQQAVTDYYNTYLGRAPQPGDVDKWLSGAYGWGGSGNLAGIATGIRLSDEGAQYSSQHTTPANVQNTAPGAFQTTGNDYSAFDTARLQQPGKSAKDAFVMLSNQAPAPPQDKAGLQAWFQKYIAPGMNNLGHKVTGINGDGFDYNNGEGNFHVDFYQNAGGGPGGGPMRLQWNATPADAATATRYNQSGGAAAGTGGMGTRSAGGETSHGYDGAMDWPQLDIPSYVPNDPFTYDPFVAPDPNDIKNDPSYQWRFDQGQKPVTNARALAGLTRGGSTMRALTDYGQNFASNEYDRIYGRAADTWGKNFSSAFDTWKANAGEHWNTYNANVDEAVGEFGPKFDQAKLQWGRDWDRYKYDNDTAYNYWNSALSASTQGSKFGTENP
jgi:hypothetical protein